MAATPEGIILGGEEKAKDVRQMCKYGENCYQKNPMHHQKFRHPSKDLVIHQKADKAEENCQKENISVDSNTNRGSKIDIEAEENVLPPYKKTKYSNVVEQSTNEKKVTYYNCKQCYSLFCWISRTIFCFWSPIFISQLARLV